MGKGTILAKTRLTARIPRFFAAINNRCFLAEVPVFPLSLPHSRMVPGWPCSVASIWFRITTPGLLPPRCFADSMPVLVRANGAGLHVGEDAGGADHQGGRSPRR